jgi:hypothetical protein
VNALLDEHIEHVTRRIKELKLLQKNLRGLRNRCQEEQATKTEDSSVASKPSEQPVTIAGCQTPEEPLAQDTSMIVRLSIIDCSAQLPFI